MHFAHRVSPILAPQYFQTVRTMPGDKISFEDKSKELVQPVRGFSKRNPVRESRKSSKAPTRRHFTCAFSNCLRLLKRYTYVYEPFYEARVYSRLSILQPVWMLRASSRKSWFLLHQQRPPCLCAALIELGVCRRVVQRRGGPSRGIKGYDTMFVEVHREKLKKLPRM